MCQLDAGEEIRPEVRSFFEAQFSHATWEQWSYPCPSAGMRTQRDRDVRDAARCLLGASFQEEVLHAAVFVSQRPRPRLLRPRCPGFAAAPSPPSTFSLLLLAPPCFSFFLGSHCHLTYFYCVCLSLPTRAQLPRTGMWTCSMLSAQHLE